MQRLRELLQLVSQIVRGVAVVVQVHLDLAESLPAEGGQAVE